MGFGEIAYKLKTWYNRLYKRNEIILMQKRINRMFAKLSKRGGMFGLSKWRTIREKANI